MERVTLVQGLLAPRKDKALKLVASERSVSPSIHRSGNLVECYNRVFNSIRHSRFQLYARNTKHRGASIHDYHMFLMARRARSNRNTIAIVKTPCMPKTYALGPTIRRLYGEASLENLPDVPAHQQDMAGNSRWRFRSKTMDCGVTRSESEVSSQWHLQKDVSTVRLLSHTEGEVHCCV
ncbi:hypothetical protein GWK47_048323 [Chionoecetes opilio]|uniref:Uncharacterized protein n=1 Tax=Chionoecetes opilio TaxID=41210 RepID=A0A8J4YCW0_CHIOP|nr:hypothetical protein GWK47_048323 [Chionoecetes opilio]